MKILRRLFKPLASLRLTLWCLAAALVLVFAGTLAQVKLGLFFVQEHYFQSWLVWWTNASGTMKLPVFPGGHLIGSLLLLNLVAAHIARFKWAWSKLGIVLTHLGLIIMLLGGLITDLFSVSSFMRLREGETKNYSEDSMRVELAVTDTSKPDYDEVTTIPASLLAKGGTIRRDTWPFELKIRGYYRNSDLMRIGANEGTTVAAASNGIGASVSVTPKSRATRLNERDIMSAVVEIIPKNGQSQGTWLVSDAIGQPQQFDIAGARWTLAARPARYYKHYSLTLRDFTHEVYPGTSIPKNFASLVQLNDDVHTDHREVNIHMNHPLRYLGDTYYQSGFEPDNSGTVLQVVRNPSYQAPYIACIVVALGLLIQFGSHLVGYLRRRASQAISS